MIKPSTIATIHQTLANFVAMLGLGSSPLGHSCGPSAQRAPAVEAPSAAPSGRCGRSRQLVALAAAGAAKHGVLMGEWW